VVHSALGQAADLRRAAVQQCLHVISRCAGQQYMEASVVHWAPRQAADLLNTQGQQHNHTVVRDFRKHTQTGKSHTCDCRRRSATEHQVNDMHVLKGVAASQLQLVQTPNARCTSV
jgi:hypothetical protein